MPICRTLATGAGERVGLRISLPETLKNAETMSITASHSLIQRSSVFFEAG